MIEKSKTDIILGEDVRKYLIECGVETPMVATTLNSGDKLHLIESNFEEIMSALGLDLSDDSLMETPKRVAKMFVNELYWGLDYNNFPKCTQIENKMGYDEMVIERDVKVMSSCEHHFVTIDGKAHVAYIPKDRVIGLSKLNRIVEFFARRPQVQERLTEQIFHTLEFILGTSDIAVVVDAVHFCVRSRGVSDVNSSTVTSKMGQRFKENQAMRMEFLSLVNGGK